MSMPNGGDAGVFQTTATTGLILVDVTGRPIYFNREAIAVLTYPGRSGNWEPVSDFLPRQIRALLPRPLTSEGAPCATVLTSGRRRYVCRAFALNPSAGTHSERMIAILLEREAGKTADISGVAQQFQLTQREQQTVGLLTLGLTSKEIATRMNISPNTVKTFFRLVMTKMGVSTRAGIVGKIARM
jgi:DNA-binding CsgD family transcriptional regulator